MNLDDFLKILSEIQQFLSTVANADDLSLKCNAFYQALFLLTKGSEPKQAVSHEHKIRALSSALEVFSPLRLKCQVSDHVADALGHFLFMEIARLVLDVRFIQLDDAMPLKEEFQKQLQASVAAFANLPVLGPMFTLLQRVMTEQWEEPTLSALMNGETVDKTKAFAYLESREYPELLNLRVDLLIENGCDSLAANLCQWMVQIPAFAKDPNVHCTHLMLLNRLGKREEFHSTCLELPCCLALQVLKKAAEKPDADGLILTLAQTFLIHHWMNFSKACCTKELLEIWLKSEHEKETNEAFIESVKKISFLAECSEQHQILLEGMLITMEDTHLQFCTEVALKAVRMDRHRLDSARTYTKNEKETDAAAAGLSCTCKIIAKIYAKHWQMKLACSMGAFYLEPSESHFKSLEDLLHQEKEPFGLRVYCPKTVSYEVYAELFEMIETLRPTKLDPRAGWESVKRAALTHMEEAGFVYQARTNSFISLSEVRERNKQREVAKVKLLQEQIAKNRERQKGLAQAAKVSRPVPSVVKPANTLEVAIVKTENQKPVSTNLINPHRVQYTNSTLSAISNVVSTIDQKSVSTPGMQAMHSSMPNARSSVSYSHRPQTGQQPAKKFVQSPVAPPANVQTPNQIRQQLSAHLTARPKIHAATGHQARQNVMPTNRPAIQAKPANPPVNIKATTALDSQCIHQVNSTQAVPLYSYSQTQLQPTNQVAHLAASTVNQMIHASSGAHTSTAVHGSQHSAYAGVNIQPQMVVSSATMPINPNLNQSPGYQNSSQSVAQTPPQQLQRSNQGQSASHQPRRNLPHQPSHEKQMNQAPLAQQQPPHNRPQIPVPVTALQSNQDSQSAHAQQMRHQNAQPVSAPQNRQQTLQQIHDLLTQMQNPQPVSASQKSRSQSVQPVPAPQNRQQNLQPVPAPQNRQQNLQPVPAPQNRQQNLQPVPAPQNRQQNLQPVPASQNRQQNLQPVPASQNRQQNLQPVPASQNRQQNLQPVPAPQNRQQNPQPVSASQQGRPQSLQPVPASQNRQHNSLPVSVSRNTQQNPEPIPAPQGRQQNFQPVSSHPSRQQNTFPVPIPQSRQPNPLPVHVSENRQQVLPPASAPQNMPLINQATLNPPSSSNSKLQIHQLSASSSLQHKHQEAISQPGLNPAGIKHTAVMQPAHRLTEQTRPAITLPSSSAVSKNFIMRPRNPRLLGYGYQSKPAPVSSTPPTSTTPPVPTTPAPPAQVNPLVAKPLGVTMEEIKHVLTKEPPLTQGHAEEIKIKQLSTYLEGVKPDPSLDLQKIQVYNLQVVNAPQKVQQIMANPPSATAIVKTEASAVSDSSSKQNQANHLSSSMPANGASTSAVSLHSNKASSVTMATTHPPSPSNPLPFVNTNISEHNRLNGADDMKEFQCKYCSECFESMSQRQRHQEWVCKQKLQDTDCSSLSSSPFHSDNAFFCCNHCNKEFSDQDALQVHISRAHSVVRDEGQDYVCEICGKAFKSKRGRITHMVKIHGFAIEMDEIRSFGSRPSPRSRSRSGHLDSPEVQIPSDVNLKKCFVKLYRLRDSDYPKRATDGEITCKTCSSQMTATQLKSHSCKTLNKCPITDISATVSSEIDSPASSASSKHDPQKKGSEESFVTEIVKFLCSKCFKTFQDRPSCEQHQNEDQHMSCKIIEYYVYECKFCQAQYQNADSLQKHLLAKCIQSPELQKVLAEWDILVCFICLKRCSSRQGVEAHFKSDHRVKHPLKFTQELEAALKKHSAVQDEKKAPLMRMIEEQQGTEAGPVMPGEFDDLVQFVSENMQIESAKAIDQKDILDELLNVVTWQDIDLSPQDSTEQIVYKNVPISICPNAVTQCKSCSLMMLLESVASHERQCGAEFPRVSMPGFSCSFCFTVFMSKEACFEHQATKCLPILGFSDPEFLRPLVPCPKCLLCVYDAAELLEHLRLFHNLDKDSAQSHVDDMHTRRLLTAAGHPAMNSKQSNDIDSVLDSVCNVQGHADRSIIFKNVSMKLVNSLKCKICTAEVMQEEQAKHQSGPCGGQRSDIFAEVCSYECPFCKVSFNENADCRNHQLGSCLVEAGFNVDVLKEPQLPCPHSGCNRRLWNLAILASHLTAKHKYTNQVADAILQQYKAFRALELMLTQDVPLKDCDAIYTLVKSCPRQWTVNLHVNIVLFSMQCMQCHQCQRWMPEGTEHPCRPFTKQLHSVFLCPFCITVFFEEEKCVEHIVGQCFKKSGITLPHADHSQDHSVEVESLSGSDVAMEIREDPDCASERKKFQGILFKNILMFSAWKVQCKKCNLLLDERKDRDEHRLSSCGSDYPVFRFYTYACPYCQQNFRSKCDCRTHQLEVCLKNNGYDTQLVSEPHLRCPVIDCSKLLYDGIDLRSHLRQKHSAEKDKVDDIIGEMLKRGILGKNMECQVWGDVSDDCSSLVSNESLSLKDESSKDSSDVRPLPPPPQVTMYRELPENSQEIIHRNLLIWLQVASECSECKTIFYSKDEIMLHSKSLCKGEIVRHHAYQCPYCHEDFTCKRTCHKHQIKECVKAIEVGFWLKPRLFCPLCAQPVFDLIVLKTHMCKSHQLLPLISKELLNLMEIHQVQWLQHQKSILQSTPETRDQLIYSCSACGIVTVTENLLRFHSQYLCARIVALTQPTELQCEKCPCAFLHPVSLIFHGYQKHSEDHLEEVKEENTKVCIPVKSADSAQMDDCPSPIVIMMEKPCTPVKAQSEGISGLQERNPVAIDNRVPSPVESDPSSSSTHQPMHDDSVSVNQTNSSCILDLRTNVKLSASEEMVPSPKEDPFAMPLQLHDSVCPDSTALEKDATSVSQLTQCSKVCDSDQLEVLPRDSLEHGTDDAAFNPAVSQTPALQSCSSEGSSIQLQTAGNNSREEELQSVFSSDNGSNSIDSDAVQGNSAMDDIQLVPCSGLNSPLEEMEDNAAAPDTSPDEAIHSQQIVSNMAKDTVDVNHRLRSPVLSSGENSIHEVTDLSVTEIGCSRIPAQTSITENEDHGVVHSMYEITKDDQNSEHQPESGDMFVKVQAGSENGVQLDQELSVEAGIKQNGPRRVLPPESEIVHCEVQNESEIESNEVQPESEIESCGRKSDLEIKSIGMMPKSETESCGIKPELETETSAMKPVSKIESNKIKPESEIESSEVEPESEIESSTIRPESEIESNKMKPESELESSEVEPESEIESSTIRPESEIESRRMVPESEIESRRMEPESETESSTMKPKSQIESSEVKPESEIVLRGMEPESKGESSAMKPESEIESRGIEPKSETEFSAMKPESVIESSEVKPELERESSEMKLESNTESSEMKPESEMESRGMRLESASESEPNAVQLNLADVSIGAVSDSENGRSKRAQQCEMMQSELQSLPTGDINQEEAASSVKNPEEPDNENCSALSVSGAAGEKLDSRHNSLLCEKETNSTNPSAALTATQTTEKREIGSKEVVEKIIKEMCMKPRIRRKGRTIEADVSSIQKDSPLKNELKENGETSLMNGEVDDAEAERNELSKHYRMDKGSKLVCLHCAHTVIFSNEYSFSSHLSLLHNIKCGKNFQTVKCPLCPAVEDSEASLQCHMKWVHSVRNSRARSVDRTSPETEASSPDALYNCPFCVARFEERIILQRHVKQSHRNHTLWQCPCGIACPSYDDYLAHNKQKHAERLKQAEGLLKPFNEAKDKVDTCEPEPIVVKKKSPPKPPKAEDIAKRRKHFAKTYSRKKPKSKTKNDDVWLPVLETAASSSSPAPVATPLETIISKDSPQLLHPAYPAPDLPFIVEMAPYEDTEKAVSITRDHLKIDLRGAAYIPVKGASQTKENAANNMNAQEIQKVTSDHQSVGKVTTAKVTETGINAHQTAGKVTTDQATETGNKAHQSAGKVTTDKATETGKVTTAKVTETGNKAHQSAGKVTTDQATETGNKAHQSAGKVTTDKATETGKVTTDKVTETGNKAHQSAGKVTTAKVTVTGNKVHRMTSKVTSPKVTQFGKIRTYAERPARRAALLKRSIKHRAVKASSPAKTSLVKTAPAIREEASSMRSSRERKPSLDSKPKDLKQKCRASLNSNGEVQCEAKSDNSVKRRLSLVVDKPAPLKEKKQEKKDSVPEVQSFDGVRTRKRTLSEDVTGTSRRSSRESSREASKSTAGRRQTISSSNIPAKKAKRSHHLARSPRTINLRSTDSRTRRKQLEC